MISWIKRHFRRIRDIGVGIAAYETLNFVYDWLFYPFALAYWGIILGGIIVTAGSVIQNVVMFWLYDRMRVDWLGAHALRELDEKENKTNIEKLATWLGRPKVRLWEKLASPLVFIVLTLPIDPLIVAIHYRKKHFTGVTLKEWGILLAAVFAANLWWLIKIGAVVEGVRFLWERFV